MNKINYFLNKNYPAIIKKYKISQLNSKEKNLLKKDTILGHWNFGQIGHLIQKKKKFAIVTGFSASGKLHLGNKIALDIAFYLGKFGGKIFIPLSDTEAELTRKTPIHATDDFNFFKSDLKRWQFNLNNSEIYLHSSNKEVNNLANFIIKKMEYKDYQKIYGSDVTLSGIFALSNMLADIFHPSQKGYKKTLVILGVDEIKHSRLAILASEKLGFPKPSFLYLKILNGLKKEKMSKSKPEQNILLSDSAKNVRHKIKDNNLKTLEIINNPLYQIALWILEIDKENLNKMSKELKYNQFVSTISQKLEERYRNLDNGKNKKSPR
jgi:tryptophanyl-tRNA synthetase